MLTKKDIQKLRKVAIVIEGIDQKFKSGNKRKILRVYDASPEEVFEIVENAIEKKTK